MILLLLFFRVQDIGNIIYCWLRCQNGGEKSPLYEMFGRVDNNEREDSRFVRRVQIKWRFKIALAGASKDMRGNGEMRYENVKREPGWITTWYGITRRNCLNGMASVC